jgi:anti-anti-sigma factor
MEELTLKKTEQGAGCVRVDVEGRIAGDTASTFVSALDGMVANGYTQIYLNMNKTTFMTSIGIRAILKTYKKLTETGGKFRIVTPSQAVRNVLGLSALEQMLAD